MGRNSSTSARFIDRLLPEIRVYLKTEDNRTRYLRLSSRVQAAAGIAALAVVALLVTTSSALVLGMLSTDDQESQARVIHEAYEARIAELSDERDQRRREAAAIQERFQLAVAQLSSQQRHLLELDTERQELTTELAMMRSHLGAAVENRDIALLTADELSTELAAKAARFSSSIGAAEDLTGTLETISLALADTAQERDETASRISALEEEVATLEFRARVNADKQERIFSQLEEAVAVTLDPLEKLLRASGKDVEQLLQQVQAQYSGAGGPFVPADLPPGLEDDPLYQRYGRLAHDLDRVHLMQIAASSIPFAVPVKTAVRYTSGFGRRSDPINGRGRMHSGQDLAGPRGTPILATANGQVVFAGRQSGYGKVIRIRHAFGYETLYAHLHTIKVKKGDTVARGDEIGGMGNTGRSTGTHLHYEIRIGGDPTNPMPYMKAARDVF